MAQTREMAAGGYAYIPGVFQYSAGVSAMPGYAIERVTFTRPVPLEQGFAQIASTLEAAHRPRTALCACELRSPIPFTEETFGAFNEAYVETLKAWDIFSGADGNPVARANVCPEIDPPKEPCFHAFAYTVEQPSAPQTFVIAGSGEAPEGKGNYRDHVIAYGNTGPTGLRKKAQFVLAEMEQRMGAFGAGWVDATAVQLYTVHDIHPFISDELGHRGTLQQGLTWHFCRPPVVGLEFEMDCRCIHLEHIEEV